MNECPGGPTERMGDGRYKCLNCGHVFGMVSHLSPAQTERLVGIGLEASYKVKRGGFLGGNTEAVMRAGLEAMLAHLPLLAG